MLLTLGAQGVGERLESYIDGRVDLRVFDIFSHMGIVVAPTTSDSFCHGTGCL